MAILKGNCPEILSYENFSEFIELNRIDQVLLAVQISEENRIATILHDLGHSTLDIFAFRLLNHTVSDIAVMPVVNLSVTPVDGVNCWIKLLQNITLSLTILVLIIPLMLLIAIPAKISSKGSNFYKQKLLGWNGKEFEILKFRFMPVDVERNSRAVWAKSSDSRGTGLGSFLRKTSLDELPQFINVLKGDMSIVGPRPERRELIEKFKDEIPDYMKKHLVKAGITGWAQVNGWRGDTCLKTRI